MSSENENTMSERELLEKYSQEKKELLERQKIDKVTNQLTKNLQETLENSFSGKEPSLSEVIQESEFYKSIAENIRLGVRNIYNDIASTHSIYAEFDKDQAEQLFSETSEQLRQVVEFTEQATNSIMQHIERHLEYSDTVMEYLKQSDISPDQVEEMRNYNNQLSMDLTDMMTTLSFQDITGQRIKKAANAIKKIEKMLLELYLSSGLILKAYETSPEQDYETLAEGTKEKAVDISEQIINSELKGPNTVTSQQDIDDLLAQFDL